MDAQLVREVSKQIGTALKDERVLNALLDKLIEARLGDLFRPIVRAALSEALGIEPDKIVIGRELVEEALRDQITAAWVAKRWLDNVKIPQAVAKLREKHGDKYEGFEDNDNAREIAKQYLVTRDIENVLENAVSGNLLRPKA